MTSSAPIALQSDEYYVNLFVENPAWSSPTPNEDEAARWTKISALLKEISAAHVSAGPMRIIDVGCGRGWLTNLAGEFGECDGVEPVAPVVIAARQLFPHLHFTAGDASAILDAPDFEPYDVVLTSEVIEHVPQSEKPGFVRNLRRLLKPGGHVILTTPRGESLREWTQLAGDPSQPVEEWLSEPEVHQLFHREQFNLRRHERVLFDLDTRRFVAEAEAENANHLIAIYQVWAFQVPASENDLAPSPFIAAEEAMVEFHRACRDAAECALQTAPDHPDLLLARAAALLNLGDVEAARRILIWTVALHAENAPARRLFAEALCRCGRADEAEAQMKRFLEIETEVSARFLPTSYSFVGRLSEGKLLTGSTSQLEVRRATIQDQTAPCIYLHPPAKLQFEVPMAGAGRFTTAIAIQPEAWNRPTAGGCEFSFSLDGREVFRKAINPRSVPAHRCWHEVSIEVPAARGEFHEFVFRTQAIGAPPDFRWALWREPVFRPHAAEPKPL